MTAVNVHVHDDPTQRVLVTLDDTTGVIATMEKYGAALGSAAKVTVDPADPLYAHWAWMARSRAGIADGDQPVLPAAGAIVGVASVDQCTVIFDTRIASPGADFAAGWVIDGSVAGDMTLLTAVLQPDGRTLLFTTTDPEVTGNDVTATYTAASGDIVSSDGDASVLGDAVVDCGTVAAS